MRCVHRRCYYFVTDRAHSAALQEWRVHNRKPGNVFKDLGESSEKSENGQPLFTVTLEVNGELLRATARSKKLAKEMSVQDKTFSIRDLEI